MQIAIDNQPINTIVRVNTLLVVATFVIGLFVDQYGGRAGQFAVSVCSWALMFRVIATSPPQWRVPLYACLVWASAGEIFLSLVWGVYTYRLENIPLFIPPGHVLLFWLGLVYSARVSRVFVAAVPVAAFAYASFSWATGFDTLSIPLIGLFLLSWLQPEGRRIYSVMLVFALVLELYGTWMGNWVWRGDVPYFELSSNNPPFAAGAFYCMLDVLVGLSVRSILATRTDLAQNRQAIAIDPGVVPKD